MTTLVKIATSNNEQYEASQETELTKLKNTIDYSKNEINEAKFNDFKKMVDDIKNYWWEYKKQYDDIMDSVIRPFEDKIQKILYKNKETKNVNAMSDEELNNEANGRMELQPSELEWQQELFQKITESGSSEEVEKLYEMVNNNMADVKTFWNEYINNVPKTEPWRSWDLSLSEPQHSWGKTEMGPLWTEDAIEWVPWATTNPNNTDPNKGNNKAGSGSAWDGEL